MKSINKKADKSLSTTPLTLAEYKVCFENFHHGYEPAQVLEQAKTEAEKYRGKKKQFSSETSIYKAMTLFDFDSGSLMLNSISDMYRTFAIGFSLDLQKEYDCKAPSEKATAELVAINFVRTLDIQFKITARLDRGEIGDIGIKYLDILSKELDRANRHYLNSLQTLKMMKQPMLAVSIKTQTAIVGQNQVVQTKNE